MDIQALKELECLRCGHRWYPRKSIVLICPECKSHLWYKKKLTIKSNIKLKK